MGGAATDRREFIRLAALASLGVAAACSKPVRSGGAASPTPSGPTPTPSPSPTGAPRALAWRALGAKGPSARRDHILVADDEGARVCLHGGRAGQGALGDMWVYDVGANSWSAVDAAGPKPRFGHNAAFIDGTLIVFGGQGGPGVFFNDVWAFDPDAKRWTRLSDGAGPTQRYGAGGTELNGALVVSHGFTDSGRFDDTWSWATRWTDVSAKGDRPIKRCLHRIAYVPSPKRIVLFGGQTNGVPFLGDTWMYDPASKTWSEAKGAAPPKRNLYAVGATKDAMIVFGGNGASGPLGDLWSFDGKAWSKLTPAGALPPARGGTYGTMISDGRMLVFGGNDGSKDLADLWELTLP